MKKFFSVLSLTMTLLLFVSVLPYQMATATEPIPETSVVSFTLITGESIVEKDPFFELLDYDTYVLLPIVKLAPRLELEIKYLREQNLVSVTGPAGQVIVIDLTHREYRNGDEKRWLEYPPVCVGEDFFICQECVEYLAQVKITWSFQKQELTINAPWLTPKTKAISTQENRKTEDEPAVQPKEGSAFSLGAIEYELLFETRLPEEQSQTAQGVLKLRSDGRAGPWSLSFGGDIVVDLMGVNPGVASLTSIKAKYRQDELLLILGDAEVTLAKTLQRKEVSGLIFLTPEHQPVKRLSVFTSISGVAAPGDEVKLFVNDRLCHKLMVTQGDSFTFKNVPLRIYRVNTIRVEITAPDGEQYETIKQIAAHPRILEKGTEEYLLIFGAYRQSGYENPEGEVLATRTRNGLTEWLSLECEAIQNQSYTKTEMTDGIDVGIAFRLFEDLICTLDWVVGGAETGVPLAQGWNAAALYCLEHGFWEAAAFKVPPEVCKGVTSFAPGQAASISGEMELTRQLLWNINANTWESLSGMKPSFSKWIENKITYRSGQYMQNGLSFTLRHEMTGKEVLDGSYLERNPTSIQVENVVKEKDLIGKLSFLYENIDWSTDQLQETHDQSAGVGWEMTKAISKSVLAGFAFTANHKQRDGAFWESGSTLAMDWKWNQPLFSVSAAGEFNSSTTTGVTGFHAESFKLTGDYQYQLTPLLSLNFQASRVVNQRNNYDFYSGLLGLEHRMFDDSGTIWGNIRYVSPLGDRIYPQWGYNLGYRKTFPGGLEMSFEVERLYSTIWIKEPENVIRLTLNQAFGFGQNRISSFKYSTDENLSLVSGTIYLDENGNRQKDPGEKPLAGITMSLDGKRAVTNAAGEYVFTGVSPGIYQLDFNYKSLPADYTPVTDAELFRIKEKENMFFDFGVTMNGTISGNVFIDKNANGVMDPEDTPLDWVGVVLDQNRTVYTTKDGEFYFENVPLGAHTISLQQESLPRNTILTDSEVREVLITEDELDAIDLLFRVTYQFFE